jgi:hypothetical protein
MKIVDALVMVDCMWFDQDSLSAVTSTQSSELDERSHYMMIGAGFLGRGINDGGCVNG